tara:strand:- start:585 stop:848 length:264 start_codon:yes stop_codon:yes gene_type:complete
MTMTTDFICAYFGKGSDGKEWTITARGFESLRQAESHGKYMMPVPGCFGFAVISEDKDAWVVFDQFSMLSGKETVTRDDFMNFTVAL